MKHSRHLRNSAFVIFLLAAFSQSGHAAFEFSAGQSSWFPEGGLPTALPYDTTITLPAWEGKGGKMTPEEATRYRINQMLHAAQDLMKEKQYDQALLKLKEVDPLPGKAPNDLYLTERMRAAIAKEIGDNALFAQSLEKAMATGMAPAAEKKNFDEILARAYYEKKDYAKTTLWTRRYISDGGDKPYMQQLLVRASYLDKDFTLARDEAKKMVLTAGENQKPPSEETLRILAGSAQNLNDQATYVLATENLATFYPKPEHWAVLIDRLVSMPNFPDSLILDVYRLMDASGQLSTAKDYRDMANAAMASGYSVEAKAILEQGLKAGILGKDAEAAQDHKLLAEATQAAGKDMAMMTKVEPQIRKAGKMNELFDLGYVYVIDGKADQGLALMERAIASGKLKSPEEARLHLGEAYLRAERKSDAIKTFKAVQASGPVGDIAKYWALLLART